MPVLTPTLVSYVPAFLRHHLAANPNPITEPTASMLVGAVLWVEVTGFAPVVSRLAAEGPEGAEVLAHLLNKYFGVLIDTLHAHGGDVAQIAGETLVVVWPAASEPDRLAQAALSAAQGALTARQALQNFNIKNVAPTLRMGLGVGEVRLAQVGGEFGLWQMVLTGPALAQARVAYNLASPQQVVVAADAWPLLQKNSVGERLPAAGVVLENLTAAVALSPLVAPPVPSEAELALKSYLVGAVLAQLAGGQSLVLADLRLATVLSVHLPHLTASLPLETLHKAMRVIQQTLYHYEGSLDKVSVTDRGAVLMAVLGLPPLAHDDDPTRAVQAAAALQVELRQFGWDCAIGVATSLVFCGSLGNDRRREYTLVGEAVLQAARVRYRAQSGEIVCDQATYAGAQEDIQFAPLPAGPEALPVYRPELTGTTTVLVGSRKQRGPITPLVGRKSERRLLWEQLQKLLRGAESGTIIMEGEAGIGKSRLVEDLLQYAQVIGVESLVGTGNAVEKFTPYFIWRSVFAQLFNLDVETDALAARQKRLERLGLKSAALRALAPLLNAVLPLELPDNEATTQLQGAVRAENTRELLLNVLQTASAQRPRLIVLEDAHFMDSASWALAGQLSQRLRSVLLVIVARPLPPPLPTEYSQILQNPTTRPLALALMSPEESLTLVCQRLGVASLPEPVAELIRTKAEGNPFFSEELAYALRDDGLISIQNNVCELVASPADLRQRNYPTNVQGVIKARIDRLPAPLQQTLKVASVIGRTFAYATLYDVYPGEPSRPLLPTYLKQLERVDLTPLETADATQLYTFKHSITQEVAYNLLSVGQRRDLHWAVAEWYEKNYAQDLAQHFSRLAYHWRQAEMPGRAIPYLDKASELALNSYANEETIEFVQQALELEKQLREPLATAQHARWALRLGEAHANATHFVEGRHHLEAGLALLGQAPPTGTVGQVWALLRQMLEQFLHRRWPQRYLGRRAAARENLLEASRVYERLTEVAFFSNQPVLALLAAFSSLNVAELAGPSPEMARAMSSVGAILGFIPLHGAAEAYCQRALALAQQFDNLPAQVWVALACGVYYAGLGRWAQARELYDLLLTLAERLGDRRHWEDGASNLVFVNYLQGDLARGLKLAEDFYRSASRQESNLNQVWALAGQAFCALPITESGAALGATQQLLQRSLEKLLAKLDDTGKIIGHGALALLALRQTQTDIALAQADLTLAVIQKSSSASFANLLGYVAIGEVYLTLWEQACAGAAGRTSTVAKVLAVQVQQVSKTLRGFSRTFPVGEPYALLWAGHVEALQGRAAPAITLWQKALGVASRLNMPLAQAHLWLALGRYAPAPQYLDYLQQAETALQQMGAVAELARVHQVRRHRAA